MKRIAVIVLACICIISCSSDDDKNASESPDLLGSWKLIEVYADPGDGSGDFVDVTSDKTITFMADETLESNGNLCNAFSNAGEPSDGAYSQEDGTIIVGTCGIVEYQISFEIIDDNLIVSYPCIEACLEKYSKIN